MPSSTQAEWETNIAPQVVPITGTPLAIASTSTRPNCSRIRFVVRVGITSMSILAADSEQPLDTVDFNQSFRVRMHYEAPAALKGASCGFGLVTASQAATPGSSTGFTDSRARRKTCCWWPT